MKKIFRYFLQGLLLAAPAGITIFAVLFPHSYNWLGEMFIVPKEHITPINLPPGEIMKFTLTGGVTMV
jgi:uncharacterized membrane protein